MLGNLEGRDNKGNGVLHKIMNHNGHENDAGPNAFPKFLHLDTIAWWWHYPPIWYEKTWRPTHIMSFIMEYYLVDLFFL
jgi:hypothetical protein